MERTFKAEPPELGCQGSLPVLPLVCVGSSWGGVRVRSRASLLQARVRDLHCSLCALGNLKFVSQIFAFVLCCWCSKLPDTGGLNQSTCIPHGSRSPRSKCFQIWYPGRPTPGLQMASHVVESGDRKQGLFLQGYLSHHESSPM